MTDALIPAVATPGAVALNGPQPGHGLGPVADDWAAIQQCMEIAAENGKSRTGETLKTYSFHLAKWRWYCEQELGRPPSTWSLQDAKTFRAYLAKLPPSSLRAIEGAPSDAPRSPFQKQPSPSAQTDILRFAKAMFSALHKTGYLRLDPMALMTVTKERRVNKKRAVSDELLDLVLSLIADRPAPTQKERQLQLRDRFVFICLREAGLRSSELIGARMSAFNPLYDPKTAATYWVLTIDGQTAKGAKGRTVPVTPILLDALATYRRAFGLHPLPGNDKSPYGLILSVRTAPNSIKLAGHSVKQAADRRMFGAWRDVGSRQGLYRIVKDRILATVDQLRQDGHFAKADHLAQVSTHWLRHSFAMASLMQGQDLRTVATSLGHASIDTTMAYTEQDALDQIHSWERENPGSIARVDTTLSPPSTTSGG